MTEKEIKQYLFSQVQEEGYNIIYFEYDVAYDLLRILKHKPNTTIVRLELFEVEEDYSLSCLDSAIANYR